MGKRGIISIVAVFTLFIFTVLGLGMLYLSQIYLKFSAYKKNSVLLDYASENGIKEAYHLLLNSLQQASSPPILSSKEMGHLVEDALKDGNRIIEKLIETETPLHHSSGWESLRWESWTSFSLKKFEEKEDYADAVYQALIQSEGKIDGFSPKRESSLECEMEILAGHIPLPRIPLLIDKNLTPEQREEFRRKNNIKISSSGQTHRPSQITFAGENLLPKEATSQLWKALKIKMFYPQKLSNTKLRAALRLEESKEPVPEGVYLIKDDMGLGGIFVQGDVEELILAVDEDFQVVSFLTSCGRWILRFSPSKGKTIFETPSEYHFYQHIPLGIIIVRGEIRSLGGGIAGPAGNIMLIKDEEIPSILNGVNLTIISSDKITISSHLIHQGFRWQEGVPYLKDSQSQLIIFAAGEDPLEEGETEGEIVIEENSSDELKIQASLIASGKGLTAEGKGKTIHILGSLQTSDLTIQKNNLKITFDQRLVEEEVLLQNAPKTKKPILYLASFKAMEWKE
jgi:hypothetical protein